MKDLLKYAIWFGIYFVLTIPFIVINDLFFPYITSKAFVFRIVVEIIFGLWLILIMKDAEFRPRRSWLFSSVFLFTLVLLLADLNAVAPFKAFWSNYERMEGFVTFAHLFAYFLVLGSMLNINKRWLWFMRANVFAGMIMAVASSAQGIKENIVRFAGPLGNPIYIAVYFLFIFFFSLLLLYRDVLIEKLSDWRAFKKVFANSWFYLYIIAALFSFFVVYRASRGALLGLVGGILVSAILVSIFEGKTFNKKEQKSKKVIRQLAIAGIILVFTIVSVFLLFRNSQIIRNNPTLSRLAEISWSNVNGQARQLIWPMALKGFIEKPILGWGQEGFNYVFNKYYDPGLYAQEPWFDRAHNAPLDFLIAGGILGLVSYLALFISALYLMWFEKNKNGGEAMDIAEKAVLTGLLAGYFFQAIFVFDNLVSYILFFTTLAYIHSNTVLQRQKDIKGESIKDKDKNFGYFDNIKLIVLNNEYQNYIFIPIIIILIPTIIWTVNVNNIKANKTLIQSLILINSGRVEEGLGSFKKTLNYKSMGDSEIREQLLSYTPNVLNAEGVSNKTKGEFLTLAINEAKKQIALTPSNARYYIFLGSVLNTIGNPNEALPYIKKAIELSPQKQAMRFELIRSFYLLGQNKEAVQEAKIAYELDTRFNQARDLYIATIENEISLNPDFKPEGERLLNTLR